MNDKKRGRGRVGKRDKPTTVCQRPSLLDWRCLRPYTLLSFLPRTPPRGDPCCTLIPLPLLSACQAACRCAHGPRRRHSRHERHPVRETRKTCPRRPHPACSRRCSPSPPKRIPRAARAADNQWHDHERNARACTEGQEEARGPARGPFADVRDLEEPDRSPRGGGGARGGRGAALW